jgi:hypothetical protein
MISATTYEASKPAHRSSPHSWGTTFDSWGTTYISPNHLLDEANDAINTDGWERLDSWGTTYYL